MKFLLAWLCFAVIEVVLVSAIAGIVILLSILPFWGYITILILAAAAIPAYFFWDSEIRNGGRRS